MNWLSSRNNRLKLETSGDLPIISEESMYRICLRWRKQQNRKMSTCNQPVGFRITRIILSDSYLPKNFFPGLWSKHLVINHPSPPPVWQSVGDKPFLLPDARCPQQATSLSLLTFHYSQQDFTGQTATFGYKVEGRELVNIIACIQAMIGQSRHLVTNELVEFEK